MRRRLTNLEEAVRSAKRYVHAAIAAADTLAVGSGSGPIHHFHAIWPALPGAYGDRMCKGAFFVLAGCQDVSEFVAQTNKRDDLLSDMREPPSSENVAASAARLANYLHGRLLRPNRTPSPIVHAKATVGSGTARIWKPFT